MSKNNIDNNNEINQRQNDNHYDNGLEQGSEVLNLNLVKGQIINAFNFKNGVILLTVVVFCSFLVLSLIFWGITDWEKSQKELIIKNNTIKINAIDGFILIEKQKINRFLKSQDKIDVVKLYLNNHVYRSNFFKLLENNILDDVYFLSYTKKSDTSYVFSSAATEVDAARAQVERFLKSKYVESASVDHVTVDHKKKEINTDEANKDKQNSKIVSKTDKYKVKFDLILNLKPDIFNSEYKYEDNEQQN